ncbi:phosphatidylserine decarboxylase [Niallia nealsonii]|uniref:phosphatidylserine decarboxylase n=1 Tax=Niallia nealsonii TaxID=115979 RepID=A0A2N0Z4S3_9BACI|nr:phosphatidylserine decarboxylase [Niallia nealsonii]PKG24515.1 phosphatidylserine decarboxylase [Niallia nealsonii]
MKSYLYKFFIELTNGKWSSYLIMKFAHSKASSLIISSFARVYKINVDEMEKDLTSYNNLHEFFIRKLKNGTRNSFFGQTEVISPVDAIIEDIGIITGNKTIHVKDKVYSISEMLGNKEMVDKYTGGTFIIFYLSPSHYHRIHSPVSGRVIKRWTLGGKSYPVNKWGLKFGKSPLAKNYRTITEVKTQDNQHIAIVKVGAMFINSIILSHQKEEVKKGEEMAYFSFGSTVILLFEKETFRSKDFLSTPYPVKIGEVIGDLSGKSK